MKVSRNDSRNIASLIYENVGEMEFDLDSPDIGGPDASQPEVVMEIDPVGEVEPEIEDDFTEELNFHLAKLSEYSTRLQELVGTAEVEPWMFAKIIKASEYIDDIYHRLEMNADFANMGQSPY